MSFITNLQSVGAFPLRPHKPMDEVAAPRAEPQVAEMQASSQLPPVAPPATSGALIMEGSQPPPAEIAAKRDGIDLDHIPIANDAAVLIDDIPTLTLPAEPKTMPESPEKPKLGLQELALPNDASPSLSEAAERIYAEARDLIGPTPEQVAKPEQQSKPAPDPISPTDPDPTIPQP